MYCDQCGVVLQSDQRQCGRCGKVVTGVVETARRRVREHVKLLGILWMAYSAMHVVGGVVMLVIAKLVFVRLMIPNGPPPEMMMWMRPIVSAIGWLILLKAAVGFVAGWGLLQREEWARVTALVVGFVTLLSVPLGTALGIYTLWVLLPSQSEEEYLALAKAA